MKIQRKHFKTLMKYRPVWNIYPSSPLTMGILVCFGLKNLKDLHNCNQREQYKAFRIYLFSLLFVWSMVGRPPGQAFIGLQATELATIDHVVVFLLINSKFFLSLRLLLTPQFFNKDKLGPNLTYWCPSVHVNLQRCQEI